MEDNPGTEQDSEPDPDNGMIVPRADQNPVENRRIQLILNAQSELENFEEQVGEFERNQIIQDLNIEDWLTPSTELYIDDVG